MQKKIFEKIGWNIGLFWNYLRTPNNFPNIILLIGVWILVYFQFASHSGKITKQVKDTDFYFPTPIAVYPSGRNVFDVNIVGNEYLNRKMPNNPYGFRNITDEEWEKIKNNEIDIKEVILKERKKDIDRQRQKYNDYLHIHLTDIFDKEKDEFLKMKKCRRLYYDMKECNPYAYRDLKKWDPKIDKKLDFYKKDPDEQTLEIIKNP